MPKKGNDNDFWRRIVLDLRRYWDGADALFGFIVALGVYKSISGDAFDWTALAAASVAAVFILDRQTDKRSR